MNVKFFKIQTDFSIVIVHLHHIFRHEPTLIYMKRLISKRFIHIALFLPISVLAQTTVPNQYFTVEISSEKAPKIDGYLTTLFGATLIGDQILLKYFLTKIRHQVNKRNLKFYTTKSIYT